MSISLLLLDNEKRFLGDTGREKSKQLVEEKGVGDGSEAGESCLNAINEITAG